MEWLQTLYKVFVVTCFIYIYICVNSSYIFISFFNFFQSNWMKTNLHVCGLCSLILFVCLLLFLLHSRSLNFLFDFWKYEKWSFTIDIALWFLDVRQTHSHTLTRSRVFVLFSMTEVYRRAPQICVFYICINLIQLQFYWTWNQKVNFHFTFRFIEQYELFRA